MCWDVQSILVPEASEFSQWEPEGVESGCPVTAVIPVWRSLTTLDMSHNCISSIDSAVVRQIDEHLKMIHIQLEEISQISVKILNLKGELRYF